MEKTVISILDGFSTLLYEIMSIALSVFHDNRERKPPKTRTACVFVAARCERAPAFCTENTQHLQTNARNQRGEEAQ